MEEPSEDYLQAFDDYRVHIEQLLATTGDLSRLEDTALEVLTDPHLLEAFRYLAAPPISGDDVKVLADASLTSGRLKHDPDRPACQARDLGAMPTYGSRPNCPWYLAAAPML